MAIVRLMLGIILLTFLATLNPAFSQNPEQTRKHMRHWRFMAHKKNKSKLHYKPTGIDT
ncbi:MAG: hypothetical protein RL060_780, partial [Bacteroidota bacterium]